MSKKARYFSADFETTVEKDPEHQTSTEVWAAAIVELFTEDVVITHGIDSLFTYIKKLKSNCIIYFHNLKFDGSFWIPYLIQKLKFKQAYEKTEINGKVQYTWIKDKDMPSKSFKYSISTKGQWYSITLKLGRYVVEIRDSTKLLPFSVKKIGEDFGTKHKKLEMDYIGDGKRYAGCPITKEEQHYIANDVLVVKEALEIMMEQGHNKMTIGSCCLAEYKKILGKDMWDRYMRDLISFEIDTELYGSKNADEYCRNSYKGGYCYVKKGQEGKIQDNGFTLDVNSLYPSMIHSDSGNKYPVGQPHFFRGNIPDHAKRYDRFYFVRFRTRFYLKKNKLPTVQIKGDLRYNPTQWLDNSDIYDPLYKSYCKYLVDDNGNQISTAVELTMTMMDYELFLEHYDTEDFEILDGVWFYAEKGIFDEYINKYREIKEHSKGAIRELAKLFLNNLYGKLAASDDSSFKICYIKEDGTLGFDYAEAHDKQPGYIPIGSAITSYARCFTIRAAQANYKYFCYADTDSIHCTGDIKKVRGVKIHESKFNCWKAESLWDKAIFTRQKTYIEHVIEKNLEPVEPYYLIKGAGITDRPKELLNMSLSDKFFNLKDTDKNGKPLIKNKEELDFVNKKRSLQDYKKGLVIPSFLKQKRVVGGIVLYEGEYTIR